MKKSTHSVLQTKAIVIGSFKAMAFIRDKLNALPNFGSQTRGKIKLSVLIFYSNKMIPISWMYLPSREGVSKPHRVMRKRQASSVLKTTSRLDLWL